jgi:hypothetical protein
MQKFFRQLFFFHGAAQKGINVTLYSEDRRLELMTQVLQKFFPELFILLQTGNLFFFLFSPLGNFLAYLFQTFFRQNGFVEELFSFRSLGLRDQFIN